MRPRWLTRKGFRDIKQRLKSGGKVFSPNKRSASAVGAKPTNQYSMAIVYSTIVVGCASIAKRSLSAKGSWPLKRLI
jgi:hypothetical protein